MGAAYSVAYNGYFPSYQLQSADDDYAPTASAYTSIGYYSGLIVRGEATVPAALLGRVGRRFVAFPLGALPPTGGPG